MISRRLSAAALAAALVLGSGTLAACDREDTRDVEEGARDVREGAEKVGNEVDKGVDRLDTDGKDD